jgi:hypothetical protein
MPHNPDTPTGATQAQSHTQPQTPTGKPEVTLKDTHDMFIAIGIMAGFVMFATIIAGINQECGRAMLGLMFLLLFLQGVGHVSPFTNWVKIHPLQPGG